MLKSHTRDLLGKRVQHLDGARGTITGPAPEATVAPGVRRFDVLWDDGARDVALEDELEEARA